MIRAWTFKRRGPFAEYPDEPLGVLVEKLLDKPLRGDA